MSYGPPPMPFTTTGPLTHVTLPPRENVPAQPQPPPLQGRVLQNIRTGTSTAAEGSSTKLASPITANSATTNTFQQQQQQQQQPTETQSCSSSSTTDNAGGGGGGGGTAPAVIRRGPGRPKGSGKKHLLPPVSDGKPKRPVGRPRKDGLPAGSVPKRVRRVKVQKDPEGMEQDKDQQHQQHEGDASSLSHSPPTPTTLPIPPTVAGYYSPAVPVSSYSSLSGAITPHHHQTQHQHQQQQQYVYPPSASSSSSRMKMVVPSSPPDPWSPLSEDQLLPLVIKAFGEMVGERPGSVVDAYYALLSGNSNVAFGELYGSLKTFWIPTQHKVFSSNNNNNNNPSASSSSNERGGGGGGGEQHRFFYWDPLKILGLIQCPGCHNNNESSSNSTLVHGGLSEHAPKRVHALPTPIYVIGCVYDCAACGGRWTSWDIVPKELECAFPFVVGGGEGDGGDGEGVERGLWTLVKSMLKNGLGRDGVLAVVGDCWAAAEEEEEHGEEEGAGGEQWEKKMELEASEVKWKKQTRPEPLLPRTDFSRYDPVGGVGGWNNAPQPHPPQQSATPKSAGFMNTSPQMMSRQPPPVPPLHLRGTLQYPYPSPPPMPFMQGGGGGGASYAEQSPRMSYAPPLPVEQQQQQQQRLLQNPSPGYAPPPPTPFSPPPPLPPSASYGGGGGGGYSSSSPPPSAVDQQQQQHPSYGSAPMEQQQQQQQFSPPTTPAPPASPYYRPRPPPPPPITPAPSNSTNNNNTNNTNPSPILHTQPSPILHTPNHHLPHPGEQNNTTYTSILKRTHSPELQTLANKRIRHCSKCGGVDCKGKGGHTFCVKPCRDCGDTQCKGRNSRRPERPCASSGNGGVWGGM